ncbi:MAG TPA: glycosyltransferase family 9 protein [Bacteroidota bacterium]|nr:glycosyltransferase family 9 protein [Bacteroidota bacterium]
MRTVVRLLERFARHAIVYPLLRLFLHNPPVTIPVDITKLRKILILRYDRIGDIIVTTPIFRLLKKANPHLFVGVLASQSNAELIVNNENVDRIHVLHSHWISFAREILSAHNEQYDLVLNFIFNRTTSGGVLSNCIAPRGIKVGQGAEKYRFYFNVLLKLERGSKHMVEVLGDIVNGVFGIPVAKKDLVFDIPSDAAAESIVEEFLAERGISRKLRKREKQRGFVVFNLSATDDTRRISDLQAQSILAILARELGWDTVVISSPSDKDWRTSAVRSVDSKKCWAFPEEGNAGLREIAALIKRARAVVTPDTAIVHLASASKTPVLGLFTPLEQIVSEWFPYNVEHKIVLAEAGLPAASIPVTLLKSALKEFLKDRK